MNFAQHSTAIVYVIDDDPAGRESLCELLQSRGLCCRSFASAEDFLEAHDHAQLGCVVTDYKMPGMNGTELQAALAERRSPLPVIIVSGFADVPVAVRAMQRGAVTLLQKPCDRVELLAAVDMALVLAQQRADQQTADERFAVRLASLSYDEQQVMRRLVDGHSNKTIARELDLGLRTVERRRQQILEKMGVGSLPELASQLAQHGDLAQS